MKKKSKNWNCRKCGRCCYNRPCFMHPEDLSKIATFLHLSEVDFVQKYCIWDYHTGISSLFLTFKRVGDPEDSIVASFGWAWDLERPCIFLDENNLCKIHEVKPKGGRLSSCSESPYTIEHTVQDWRSHPLLLKLQEYAREHDIFLYKYNWV